MNALEVVADAAANWAHELRQYIAPGSEDWGDHESAAAQRAQADEIDAAIAALTERPAADATALHEKAERIARQAVTANDERLLHLIRYGSPVDVYGLVREVATAAALAALTERENAS